jgi:hypothetical protein
MRPQRRARPPLFSFFYGVVVRLLARERARWSFVKVRSLSLQVCAIKRPLLSSAEQRRCRHTFGDCKSVPQLGDLPLLVVENTKSLSL